MNGQKKEGLTRDIDGPREIKLVIISILESAEAVKLMST